MKNAFDGLDTAKEGVFELQNVAIEISKTKNQRKEPKKPGQMIKQLQYNYFKKSVHETGIPEERQKIKETK
jgi:hypothetical protein